MQRLGLDTEGLGEVLAVVGLFNLMNSLADAYQVEPDILPVTGERPGKRTAVYVSRNQFRET